MKSHLCLQKKRQDYQQSDSISPPFRISSVPSKSRELCFASALTYWLRPSPVQWPRHKLLPKPEFPESKPFKDTEPCQEEATITGFRFFDMELLSTAFSSMRCAECAHFTLMLSENHLERKGCASSFRVFCENCGWRHVFWTSKNRLKVSRKIGV